MPCRRYAKANALARASAEALALDRSARSAARLRHDPRAPLAITCRLRIGGGPWRVASVVDISRSGFRLAWLPHCAVGTTVWLRLPGLEALPGVIRWHDIAGVGCEFAQPRHPSVIEHLARRGPALTA